MNNQNRAWLLAVALGAVVLLAGCERPPPKSVQQGYRGTGMVAVTNPRADAMLQANNVMPPALPPAEGEAPLAKDVYKNVQVLTDLNVTEFVRQMTNQAAWVAPTEQCAYCHNLNDFASDEKYTKVVARRMLQMTRDININWQKHILQTGVTCYTCHRGKPVPQYVWFDNPGPRKAPGEAGWRDGQNIGAMSVGLTAMPYDPFNTFLVQDGVVKIQSLTPLPSGDPMNIKQTESSYALMMHMSQALGSTARTATRRRTSASGTTPRRSACRRGSRSAWSAWPTTSTCCRSRPCCRPIARDRSATGRRSTARPVTRASRSRSMASA